MSNVAEIKACIARVKDQATRNDLTTRLNAAVSANDTAAITAVSNEANAAPKSP